MAYAPLAALPVKDATACGFTFPTATIVPYFMRRLAERPHPRFNTQFLALLASLALLLSADHTVAQVTNTG
jgi:hypothetical protein